MVKSMIHSHDDKMKIESEWQRISASMRTRPFSVMNEQLIWKQSSNIQYKYSNANYKLEFANTHTSIEWVRITMAMKSLKMHKHLAYNGLAKIQQEFWISKCATRFEIYVAFSQNRFTLCILVSCTSISSSPLLFSLTQWVF